MLSAEQKASSAERTCRSDNHRRHPLGARLRPTCRSRPAGCSETRLARYRAIRLEAAGRRRSTCGRSRAPSGAGDDYRFDKCVLRRCFAGSADSNRQTAWQPNLYPVRCNWRCRCAGERRVLGLDEVHASDRQTTDRLEGHSGEKLLDLRACVTAPYSFSGSAREAAGHYPQNANATVVTALGRYRPRPDPGSRWWPTQQSASMAIASWRGVPSAGWKFWSKTTRWRQPESSELTALSLCD